MGTPSTAFHGGYPWERLRIALKGRRVIAAVAYVGRGSATSLPLAKGSILVVNASRETVRAGLTCPNELLAWHRKGVHVFSRPNLHAKVFVVGTRAFVGSTNVSQRSAGVLTEAILETSDRRAVDQVRNFVLDLQDVELHERALEELQKHYRLPTIPGHQKRPRNSSNPSLFLIRAFAGEWTEKGLLTADEQRPLAEKNLRDGERSHIEEYEFMGEYWSFRINQVLMVIDTDRNGTKWVNPPGRVVRISSFSSARGQRGFVLFLEVPYRRRRALSRFVPGLSARLRRRMKRNGRLAAAMASELLYAWNR